MTPFTSRASTITPQNGNSLNLEHVDVVCCHRFFRRPLFADPHRSAFGGNAYDDMLTRLKLAQAFGRLIRRKSDRGIFVLLDPQTPTRLLSTFPPDAPITRLGLADAVHSVRTFFGDPLTS